MMFYKETEFKHEPPLGNVPKEWEVVKLKDVADYLNGYPFSPKDWKDKGLPIIRIQNLNDPDAEFNYFDGDIEDRYIVENGDLLFSWSASIGAYIWNRGKAVLNQHIFKVIPNGNVDKLYLYYVLFLAIEQLKRRVHGSTMKHFKKTELETKIPLPPLGEQKKIAEVLGVVDSAVGLVDRVILKTERLKKGLMQTLLTRGIGHKEYKQTPIGTIPKEWQIATIGDVCEQRNEIVQPSMNNKELFVGLEHIASGETRLHNFAQSADVKSTKFRFYAGDILYGKLRPYLDKAVIADFNGICSTDLLVLASKESLLKEFLIYVLHSDDFIKHAIATTTGTNHPRTSWSAISKFRFGLPGRSEQQKIAEILSAVDAKLEIEKKEKARLERIKQGLMDLLLTGKIRIKVD